MVPQQGLVFLANMLCTFNDLQLDSMAFSICDVKHNLYHSHWYPRQTASLLTRKLQSPISIFLSDCSGKWLYLEVLKLLSVNFLMVEICASSDNANAWIPLTCRNPPVYILLTDDALMERDWTGLLLGGALWWTRHVTLHSVFLDTWGHSWAEHWLPCSTETTLHCNMPLSAACVTTSDPLTMSWSCTISWSRKSKYGWAASGSSALLEDQPCWMTWQSSCIACSCLQNYRRCRMSSGVSASVRLTSFKSLTSE